jgi:hypothetical protein
MTRILPALIMTATALSLTACSEKEGNGSLSIDMNSQADAGNVSVSIPGFDAKVKVPTGIMGSGNFDIDGVKLYPKSTVTSFNLNVDSKTTGGNSSDPVVKMNFAAPADVATVTNWYKGQFAAKSVTATQTATGFSGRTEDGDTFTIAFTPGAAGQTNGAIVVVDTGK